MSEERITAETTLVGNYTIIARGDGFTLSEISYAVGRYERLKMVIFKSYTLASDVARLFSLSFKDGVSSGSIGFRLDDLGFVEVVGGKSGFCKLYRWNKERKQASQPFLIANSPGELEDGLLEFLRDQNGNQKDF